MNDSSPINLLFEIHSDLPRQGPGSTDSTAKALSLIPQLPDSPQILDVGCGPGAQTMVLAKTTGGLITAVDFHKPYLEELMSRATTEGVTAQIQTLELDMRELNFDDASFDLIWAEGSIYIIGVESGLSSWRRFLKPTGCIAFTEVSWLTDEPESEVRKFWDEAYPEMRTIEENVALISQSGFELIESFTLPEKDWWSDYYTPLELRLLVLRDKYSSNVEALKQINSTQEEIEIYRKHSKSYGYVFYIARRER